MKAEDIKVLTEDAKKGNTLAVAEFDLVFDGSVFRAAH